MDPAALTNGNNKATDFYSFCILALEVLTGHFIPIIPTLDDLTKRNVPVIPEDIPWNLRLHLSSGFDKDQGKRSGWTDVIVALRKCIYKYKAIQKLYMHFLTDFDIEQEIDKKNGGTFISNTSIRKYSVKSNRRNEIEVNPKMTDKIHFLKSLTDLIPSTRKKHLLVALLVITVLVASGIIVPLTIYALNNADSSAVPTTTLPSTTSTPHSPEKCRYATLDLLVSQNTLYLWFCSFISCSYRISW